jgi:hypothetical protein
VHLLPCQSTAWSESFYLPTYTPHTLSQKFSQGSDIFASTCWTSLWSDPQDWDHIAHLVGFCASLSGQRGNSQILVGFCLVTQTRLADLLLALALHEVVLFQGWPPWVALIGGNSYPDKEKKKKRRLKRACDGTGPGPRPHMLMDL